MILTRFRDMLELNRKEVAMSFNDVDLYFDGAVRNHFCRRKKCVIKNVQKRRVLTLHLMKIKEGTSPVLEWIESSPVGSADLCVQLLCNSGRSCDQCTTSSVQFCQPTEVMIKRLKKLFHIYNHWPIIHTHMYLILVQ